MAYLQVPVLKYTQGARTVTSNWHMLRRVSSFGTNAYNLEVRINHDVAMVTMYIVTRKVLKFSITVDATAKNYMHVMIPKVAYELTYC